MKGLAILLTTCKEEKVFVIIKCDGEFPLSSNFYARTEKGFIPIISHVTSVTSSFDILPTPSEKQYFWSAVLTSSSTPM